MMRKISIIGIIACAFGLFSFFKGKKNRFTDERDGNSYKTVVIGNLVWMKDNLRFQTKNSYNPREFRKVDKDCGMFYSYEESRNVCPDGWRLPTEKEMTELVHLDSINKIDLVRKLDISLCGNSDRGVLTRIGLDAAFWLDAEMKDEHVAHWHTYKTSNVVHSHNVDQVQRKYPVRCVCELEK